LINLSGEPYEVAVGDKIAQCVLQKFEPVEIVEAEALAASARGAAGFGSSGR
jgi:dUTP pyrophosphatase